jgi:hypothetical protein
MKEECNCQNCKNYYKWQRIKLSLKFGTALGFAWSLIFFGCLANIPNTRMAFELAAVIFAVVLGIVLTAHQWIPALTDMLDRWEEDENKPQ